jgi:hypothetical protein
MSNWYEVRVSKTWMVLVEVEEGADEWSRASRLAMEEVEGDEAEMDNEPLTGERLESAKRHADEVLPL